jgi:hypothetical protein
MKQTTTIIRMGAANWDVTIPHPETGLRPLYFDLRRMTKDERRKFHAEFMGAYRTVNPMRERSAA